MDELLLYAGSVVVALVGGYLLGGASSGNGRVEQAPASGGSEALEAKIRSAVVAESPPPGVSPRGVDAAAVVRQSESKSPEVTSYGKLVAPGKTRRVIIVSRSLPVSFRAPNRRGGDWEITWKKDNNIFRAIRSLQKADASGYEMTWVGCVDAFSLKRGEAKALQQALAKHNCVPVFIESANLRERFFSGFCKGVLWRLMHYVMPQADVDFGKEWEDRWTAYREVNKAMAETICSIAGPSDAIWVHGYPALLVPEFVRERLPLASIGLFVHAPWPTADVVRCLPERARILRAMLSADVVGFHTYDYARHFLSACQRIVALDYKTVRGGRLGVRTPNGRTVLVEVSHLGINASFFKRISGSKACLDRAAAIRAEHKGRQIIMGVDHLDLVKGTHMKMQAYERFLRTNPDWADRVVMVQVLLPSSNKADEQKRVLDSVMSTVRTLQADFGEGCVRVINGTAAPVSIEEIVALYSAADAALISTFWDGLNLIPYEFTASQPAETPGVLILSEFMGCTRSLSGAIRVNPWSLQSVSDAITTALNMQSTARIKAHRQRYAYVMKHTTEVWARAFLEGLDASRDQLQREISFMQIKHKSGGVEVLGVSKGFSRLTSETLEKVIKPAARRVFFLDYDGTLISEEGQDAIGDETSADHYATRCAPSQALLALLKALVADPKNIVFVISGRQRKQLQAWLGDIQDLGLAAEKGCFLRWPKHLRSRIRDAASASASSQSEWVSNTDIKAHLAWKREVKPLLEAYTRRTDGSYMEEKEVSLSWHYDAADPEFGATQAQELRRYIEGIVSMEHLEIRSYTYHKILNVKPKGIDKGSTIHSILSTLFLPSDGKPPLEDAKNACVFAAGDEASDEKMFRVLRRATSTKSLTGDSAGGLQSLDLRAITCCVGVKPSDASFFVHQQPELLKILSSVGGKRYGGT